MQFKIKIVGMLFYFVLCGSLYSQGIEIIFKLNKGTNVESFLTEMNSEFTEVYSKSDIKLISKDLNICLFKIKKQGLNQGLILNKLNTFKTVKECQFNHEVGLRKKPNDQFYQDQWQYQNRVKNNGIIDADIDASEAWNMTTGGYTVDGQEIVVAVIDDGFLINHPDLKDNIWTNQNEIPNNQIDDDNNGYIDDIHGWNYRSRNADVSNQENGNWHGTPVAGIIGAIGDNDIGVAGVNWNIKIMPIIKGNQLSTIVEAYDYIYQMRKKYNDTNGKEGAFIVATNASFGMAATPLEAPTWCSIYDDLGTVGIVNIGATANSSLNVDVEGDLPTSCPSQYLISVTNTTRLDKKEAFAAYGLQNIDLGAPGSDVFTISNDGSYATFGGTSASAPHVTGVVGLMYSLEIPEFILDVQKDPGAMALLIKESLLVGTDQLADLADITVSGGRLNAYKALVELNNTYNITNYENTPLNQELIYPNPATDQITISLDIDKPQSIAINIYDQLGKSMFRNILGDVDEGHHEILLDIQSLPKGIYFIQLQSNNNSSFRFIKN